MAATAAAMVGLINVASALTPNIRWRGHLLLDFEPVEKRSERGLAKLIALGNPFFQIESLYRFNAKFFPRWEPRYLVYDGAFGLPRASIAALRAEGQLPKPSLRRPQRAIRAR